MGQLFSHEESVKFQNPSNHHLKVSNFTEKWEKSNSVILSKYEMTFSKVNQVIYSSAKISIPNTKAIAQILLRYLAHKIFKFCFQRDITQKRGITWG